MSGLLYLPKPCAGAGVMLLQAQDIFVRLDGVEVLSGVSMG